MSFFLSNNNNFDIEGKNVIIRLMKIKNLLILIPVSFISTSCVINGVSDASDSKQAETTSNTSGTTTTTTTSQPTEVTVAAHTLSDSNPPIDVDSTGDVITQDDFDRLLNAPQSSFNGNYNYTYTYYSGGNIGVKKYTKKGYSIQTSSGTIYYEKKSGSTFYKYSASSKGGYLRTEETLNLQNEYTYTIWHEVYVHLNLYDVKFDDYTYNEGLGGVYQYSCSAFSVTFKMQSGYLTYLYYGLSGSYFYINLSFETTISIPKSYYLA